MTPVHEIIMLLGDKVVEIHERDKRIRMLEDLAKSLNEDLQQARMIIKELSPRES